MTPPIWYDWVYHPAQRHIHDEACKDDGIHEDMQGFSIAFWRGAMDDGRPVSVPCVYADADVLRNTPAEMENLKAALKANGLSSYYDLGREMYFDTSLTSGA